MAEHIPGKAVLYHAFMFLILLLILTTFEELFVGLLHHRAAVESLSHVVGSTFLQAFSVCLIVFLILIPTFRVRFSWECTREARGGSAVFRQPGPGRGCSRASGLAGNVAMSSRLTE
jgi:hypothetical protein